MKKVFILLSVAALAACVSCSNFKGGVEYTDKSAEYQQPKGSLEEKSFESPADPVQVVSDANAPKFVWETGDAVTVFDGKQSYKFTVNADGSVVSFDGEAYDASEVYAVYPYDPQVSFVDGKVKMPVSNTQYLVEGSIAKANNILIGHAASLKSVGAIDFKSALAYVKFTVDLEDSPKSIQLSTKGGESLAGSVNIKLDDLTAEFAEGVSSVNLLSNEFDGTYYVAVAPQTYSEGLILTLTNRKGSSASVKFPEISGTVAGGVVDLGVIDESNVFYPSTIKSVNIFKASFKDGEFNVISEPGFEDFPDKDIKYHTRWIFEAGDFEAWDKSKATNDFPVKSGEVSLKLTGRGPGWTWHQYYQPVAYMKNTDYTWSFEFRTNGDRDFYGCHLNPDYRNIEICSDNARAMAGTWANWDHMPTYLLETLTFNTEHRFYGETFTGAWSDEACNYEVYADNYKLYPTNARRDSFDPAKLESKGVLYNATKGISSNGRVVIWKNEEGTYQLAIANPTVEGQSYDNIVAFTSSVDIAEGVTISEFGSQIGAGIVPDAAIAVGGKTYVHYYLVAGTDPSGSWSVEKSGFAVSEDGGQTWTLPDKAWVGGPDNRFAQVSLVESGDGNVYMTGTYAGRIMTPWNNFFIARAPKTSDLSDPASYEYWNGTIWAKGVDPNSVYPEGLLCVGDTSEPCLAYNAKYDRYMLIYRSMTLGGLVYRDAEAPQGPWSGEKILTQDETHGALYSPSVLKVEANGSVWFCANVLQ